MLVVGASHSGCDIAYEAAATHPTILVGPDGGEIPVPFTSPLMQVVFPVIMFGSTHVLTRSNPLGARPWREYRTTVAAAAAGPVRRPGRAGSRRVAGPGHGRASTAGR